eukprot:bmy_19206T0
MKGALGSPVAAAAAGAAMQESFGCVVANRFHQLLDDESDPFDILREAERRRQQQLQRKRRDEAAGAAAGAGNRGGRSPAGASGHRPGAGGGRRESQKERKSLPAPGAQQPDSPGGGPQPPGQKRTARRGEQQGWSESGGTESRAEILQGYRPYETERQADFTPEKFTDEKPVDRFDRDRPLRGRGGPRGGMRSRGRGGPGNRAFDGQKRTSRRGEQQGWSETRGTEVTLDRAERRSYREYRPYETERQADFTPEKFTDEKPVDRFDRDRPLRGRGGPRGGMRSRGRGGPGNRAFDGFDQRGKREFERYSGNDKIAIRTEDNMGGYGVRTWGSGKDTSDMDLTAPMEETTVVEESLGPLEAESPAKWSHCPRYPSGASQQISLPLLNMLDSEHPVKIAGAAVHRSCSLVADHTEKFLVPELEVEEETQVQEMTLDEWKNLQEQTRPKPEFNIRKPESTVPSKAVVIHKSKYRDDLVKDDYEDDAHVFRKAANDITSQLEINFGNLPRPGRGARGGTRGGRGRIRRAENYGLRAEVVGLQGSPMSAMNARSELEKNSHICIR